MHRDRNGDLGYLRQVFYYPSLFPPDQDRFQTVIQLLKIIIAGDLISLSFIKITMLVRELP